LFSGSLAEATGSSFHSITALVPMRYQLITFSFYFNLGVILIYSPRSYEAGAFLISALRGLPPALDNDFSMNLPFSLPMNLCLQQ